MLHTFRLVDPRDINTVQGLHGSGYNGGFVVVAIELQSPCLQEQPESSVRIVWTLIPEVVAAGRK